MKHHPAKPSNWTAPQPLTPRQLRRLRRQAEQRQQRRIAVPLADGKRYAVLVVELADGTTKEQVETGIEGLPIINEVTDMAPLRRSQDAEADESQVGRVVVDKITDVIEVEEPQ